MTKVAAALATSAVALTASALTVAPAQAKEPVPKGMVCTNYGLLVDLVTGRTYVECVPGSPDAVKIGDAGTGKTTKPPKVDGGGSGRGPGSVSN